MKKNKVIMYTKPTCSKCRQALTFLREHHIEPHLIEYLEDFPDEKTLQNLIQKSKLTVMDFIRTKEPVFIEKFKNKSFTTEQWIKVLVNNNNLLQRPILVNGNKVIIGRSDEALNCIL